MMDLVKKPPHYRLSDVESLDGEFFETDVLNLLEALDKKINDVFSGNQEYISGIHRHYLYSTIAYLFRAPFKGTSKEDIKKAIFYLRKLIGEDPRKDGN